MSIFMFSGLVVDKDHFRSWSRLYFSSSLFFHGSPKLFLKPSKLVTSFQHTAGTMLLTLGGAGYDSGCGCMDHVSSFVGRLGDVAFCDSFKRPACAIGPIITLMAQTTCFRPRTVFLGARTIRDVI